jgi:carbon-monoxide dehydrogenase medium subunit
MFPVDFGYVRAVSLRHALDELAATPDAKLLAGGQSLLPMMKLRLAAPEALVDIGGLPELTGVTGTTIGAATTYRALSRDPALLAAYPALADALAMLADPQVRARGTAGGAIAHGSRPPTCPRCCSPWTPS